MFYKHTGRFAFYQTLEEKWFSLTFSNRENGPALSLTFKTYRLARVFSVFTDEFPGVCRGIHSTKTDLMYGYQPFSYTLSILRPFVHPLWLEA